MKIRFLSVILLTLMFYQTSANDRDQLMDSLLYWNGMPENKLKVNKLNRFSFDLIFYDMEKATEYANNSLHLAEKLDFLYGQMGANNNLSLIFINQNKYKEAISYTYRALDLALQLQDFDQIAYQYSRLAMIYRYLESYEDALRFYEKIIALQDSISFKPEYFAKRGMSLVYRDMHDFEQSNAVLLNLITLCEQEQDEIKKGILLNDIGRNYLLEQKYEQALDYFYQSLRIKKVNNDPRLRMAQRDIGETYAAMGQYDSAFYFLYASLALCVRQNHSFGSMSTHIQLANTYYQLNSFDSALLHAENAMTYADQLNLLDHKRDLFKKMADVYHVQNNPEKAFQVLSRYNQLNDSIYQLDSRNMLETYITLEKQENELNSQQASIKMLAQKKAAEAKLKWAFLGMVFLMGVVLLLVYQKYKNKYKSELVLTQKNQEIARKNQEISEMNQLLENKLFRLQMDPHFIFNSLSAVQHFITISDQDAALLYLNKFSRLIRQVLENSTQNNVPIVDELNLLKHYLELESLRFNHSFTYEIIVKKNVDIYNLEIPFLLIQPFVENAINHGLKGIRDGKLMIEVSCDNEFVQFIIEDNGIGREKSGIIKKAKHYKPMGMSINYQRLERFGKTRVKSALVNVVDLKDKQNQAFGTRVEIKLPIAF